MWWLLVIIALAAIVAMVVRLNRRGPKGTSTADDQHILRPDIRGNGPFDSY